MPRVGCQMIIFGERSREDFPGVLDDVRRAGYEAYEGRALASAQEAIEVKKQAADHELVCAGFHTGIAAIQDEGGVSGIAEAMNAMGVRYLCNSGVFDRDTIAGYQRSCGLLNTVGKRLREAGLVFCYHDHAWEFEPLEGTETRGMDILLEGTDPEYVKLCVDVYWVAIGNQDPAAFIRQNRDRCGYFHFKDGTRDRVYMPLGRGFVDLKATANACEETGFEWILVEQDRPVDDAYTEAKESREFLGTLGY